MHQIPPEDAQPKTTGMTSAQQRFFASPECTRARRALQRLVDSAQYHTDSSYFREADLQFVDRHLHYLSTHPTTNIDGYISNLKLMTGFKSR